MTSGVTKSSWVTPTKPSYEHFQSVGHSLFALLAGLLGGAVAVWFCARQALLDVAGPASCAAEQTRRPVRFNSR